MGLPDGYVQTVALQHATDTLDHITVDTLDLSRLEGARGQEHDSGAPHFPQVHGLTVWTSSGGLSSRPLPS